jgi:hypothetical protein
VIDALDKSREISVPNNRKKLSVLMKYLNIFKRFIELEPENTIFETLIFLHLSRLEMSDSVITYG